MVTFNFYREVKIPLKPKLGPFILQQKLLGEGLAPVIYYPQIEGSDLPLVTGLLGSYEVLGLALGMDPKKLDKAEINREFRRRVVQGLMLNFKRKVLSSVHFGPPFRTKPRTPTFSSDMPDGGRGIA